ncbi:MAG TPA: hypothetical protein PK530_04350 [Anaerolineales bacterium]|nr:hypothetical protein [Anaerolineales bacterium]
MKIILIRSLAIGFVFLLGMTITACATLPATSQGNTPPTLPAATDLPAATPNPIGELAIQALAAQLGLSAENITLQSLEGAEWPNGCLGIDYKDTACTDVIVPGYRLLLEAKGETYEYRSNLNGSLLLLAAPIVTTPDNHVEELAREALAVQLGIAKEAITLVSVEAVEWPDSCLGITFSEKACATVITPGYRIILEANGQTYEYHSNKDGSQMLLASAIPATGEIPALQLNVEGGIVGFCDHVNLFASGLASYQSCQVTQETRYQLTPQQLETLQKLVNQYGVFEYTLSDPAVADQMTVQIIFNGKGTQPPTDELYQQLQALGMEVINLARGLTPNS